MVDFPLIAGQDWWGPVLGVALSAATLTIMSAYLAGTFLADEKLKAWARREVFQIFFSLIIILFAAALIPGALGFLIERIGLLGTPAYQTYVQTLCDPSNAAQLSHPNMNMVGRPCHVRLALDYLDILFKSSESQTQSLLYSYGWVSLIATIGSDQSLSTTKSPNTNVGFLAGFSMIANAYSLLFDLAIKNMVVIRFQQFFIDFFATGFFPVLFGMGLILRIPSYTRKLGGLLIAISLGFYIVFPLFYALAGAILFTMSNGWGPSTAAIMTNQFNPGGQVNPATGTLPTAIPQYRGTYVGISGQNPLQPPIGSNLCAPSNPPSDPELAGFFTLLGAVGQRGSQALDRSWTTMLLRFWSSPFEGPTSDSLFGMDGVADNVAKIFVFSVVMPFLALMTTLAGVKAFSPLLGGDVEISGLTRLI